MSDSAPYLILASLWLGYFVIHSVLASVTVKSWVARRWPGLMPVYRITFNTLAVVLLLPPLGLTFAWQGPVIWDWPGWTGWVANGLALLAGLAVLASLRSYDGHEFLGLRQWRGQVRAVEDQETFHISPFHRFVRHPWYLFGLVIIWTRAWDPAWLTAATCMTLYFVIGSRFEERKLMRYHGEPYRVYRRYVPALVPLPWRYLSPDEARRLERSARREVPAAAEAV